MALQKRRKQKTLPCYGTAEWKGLTSKAGFLRAWVTQADSWGMHAAAQPGRAPQIQKAASSALSLGALGCLLLSLALAASGEPHNTHLTLLQWPQLLFPDLNCTCRLTHHALFSTSLVTKPQGLYLFLPFQAPDFGAAACSVIYDVTVRRPGMREVAFQESHFFPMKSMHNPNTQSMFSTTDK